MKRARRSYFASLHGQLIVGAIVAAVALVAFTATSDAAQPRVGLGTANDFAVLAGSTITNLGPTTIAGDIGLAPGTSVTGFGPGANSVTQVGALHVADAVAVQAKSDLVLAYNDAAGRGPATPIGRELGGLTLPAGVYDSPVGFFQITGTLTLDAENDPDAVFIFQMESTLITAPASAVNVINGGDPCNVIWQVGSSATLDTTTSFKGTILALTSISLNTGATIIPGRALARNGAVTMDTNTIAPGPCTAGAAATPAPTATPRPARTATPTAAATVVPTAGPTSPPPLAAPPASTATSTPTARTSTTSTPFLAGGPNSPPPSTFGSATPGVGLTSQNEEIPLSGAPVRTFGLIGLALIFVGALMRRVARSPGS